MRRRSRICGDLPWRRIPLRRSLPAKGGVDFAGRFAIKSPYRPTPCHGRPLRFLPLRTIRRKMPHLNYEWTSARFEHAPSCSADGESWVSGDGRASLENERSPAKKPVQILSNCLMRSQTLERISPAFSESVAKSLQAAGLHLTAGSIPLSGVPGGRCWPPLRPRGANYSMRDGAGRIEDHSIAKGVLRPLVIPKSGRCAGRLECV